MSSQFEHGLVAPTFIEHGFLVDTAIRLTTFDPRTGGFYKDANGDFQQQAAYDPSFDGELCAFIVYSNGQRTLKMLCGYDDGSGLGWKPIQQNQDHRVTLIDIRTNDVFDEHYLENCMPPWLCE